LNAKRGLLIPLLLLLMVNCTSIKIGVFRGAMKLFGGKIYESKFIALNDPNFISSYGSIYLEDEEEVIGVYINGVAKAYPLTMAFHHHIFNDEFNGKRVLITFCPLTHTAMVFDPVIEGRNTLNFIVEGGLKESNMIMCDDATESEWIQVTREAIKGEMKGKKLDLLFSLHTTWNIWKQLHPKTLVLSRDTGFDKDYSRFPFQEKYFKYKKTSHFLFKVSNQDDRYHPKEIVLVVEIGDTSKVYPVSAMQDRAVINDLVASIPIVVIYDKKSETIAAFSRKFEKHVLDFRIEDTPESTIFKDSVYDAEWNLEGMAYKGSCKGKYLKPVASFKAFWFAWLAFNPETLVYSNSSK
jgi:hypothetical protein